MFIGVSVVAEGGTALVSDYMTRIKHPSGVYSLEIILSKHTLTSHLEMPYFDGDCTKYSRFSGHRKLHNEIPKADNHHRCSFILSSFIAFGAFYSLFCIFRFFLLLIKQ